MQLRQDNELGTLFNMVGFQTKLKHGEQARIFRTMPGLERPVRSARRPAPQHVPHSPNLLDETLRLKTAPRLRFAGQITGCEGYVEIRGDRASGRPFRRRGTARRDAALPPPTTAHGALLGHITGGHIETIDAGRARSSP